MDKPLSMRLDELRKAIANVINEAKIPMYLVDPITRDIALEVSSAAKQQAEAEKAMFEKESAQSTEE